MAVPYDLDVVHQHLRAIHQRLRMTHRELKLIEDAECTDRRDDYIVDVLNGFDFCRCISAFG